MQLNVKDNWAECTCAYIPFFMRSSVRKKYAAMRRMGRVTGRKSLPCSMAGSVQMKDAVG